MITKNIYLSFISFLLFFLSLSAQDTRPKIGLVLSGGGARGLAHIGTLKLIDSLNIPVDYVAGTSMGGIVGALYAAGFTGNEIEKYVLATDWDEMFLDKPPRAEIPYLEKKDDGKFQLKFGLHGITPVIPSGLIGGQNISLKFAELTSAVGEIKDFDKLPIPYRCVAIDLITGNEVILKEGSLWKAMRATMAIPTVFSPVEWGDSLLIDGGVINNFPADILKDMGADVIIGVNVGSQLLRKEELGTLLGVLQQTMVLTDLARQRDNYKLCEIFIQPELDGFTAADFDSESVEEIVKRGIEAAEKNKDRLVEFKNKYAYGAGRSHEKEYLINNPHIISSIVLMGESSYTLIYLYELIGHRPNDILDVIKLEDKIAEMKISGVFENVDYDVAILGGGELILYFQLTEQIKPVIHGLSIEGNENLHFEFIIDILGIRPGEPFDKIKLSEQIKYMSSLGYFEKVTYTIEPIRENFIQIKIKLKEKPLRRMSLGFRYDDRYKIVGILALQANNIPFPGLRTEMCVQFAGLFKFDYMAMYPSRTLDFPLYPYFKIAYKDIPIDIFSHVSGERIAEYNDVSWLFGIGFGHIIRNTGVIRIEYNHEYPAIDPNIAGLDPDYFPSWKDKLRVLHADLSIDRLDDPITPRKGFLIKANYDASLKDLGSDLEYRHYQIDAKFCATIGDKHTFCLKGYYTNAFDEYPIYKWPIKGGADTFVGMKINQIEGYNFGYLRLDYRYEFEKDIFLKLILNAGNFNIAQPDGPLIFNNQLYGFGAGIKLLTIVGPFELIFSQGSKSITQYDQFQTEIYFTAGYNF